MFTVRVTATDAQVCLLTGRCVDLLYSSIVRHQSKSLKGTVLPTCKLNITCFEFEHYTTANY